MLENFTSLAVAGMLEWMDLIITPAVVILMNALFEVLDYKRGEKKKCEGQE